MPAILRRSVRDAAPTPSRAAKDRRSVVAGLAVRRVLVAAAVGGLAVTSLTAPAAHAAGTTAGAAAAPAAAHPVPDVVGHVLAPAAATGPLPTSACEAKYHIACYTPLQYRVAYNLNPVYDGSATGHKITGKGETIDIVDSFGSPTIRNDLHAFDQQFGFKDPKLTIDQFGAIPPYDPTNATMVGWAEETTLDVEYAHSIAPDANIVLAETPVAETEGVTGFPEMMAAESSLIHQGVGDVISQSFGATENTFPGFSSGDYSSLYNLRYAYQEAYTHHVSVLGGSGDQGVTGAEADGSTLYPYRVNSWPSSDPLVTSVGGTMLNLDDNGNRLSPDVVWNDGYGASGGGSSAVFGRPAYQNVVANVVGGHRGTPDISMTAAVNGGAWVYWTFGGATAGWNIIGGTSEATPIMSGIVALADQQAGHRLGLINPGLYALGVFSRIGVPDTGIVDVTSGNNTFGGVTGYNAGPGYDLTTGWGTIDAARFVPMLARVG